jgi:phage protein U
MSRPLFQLGTFQFNLQNGAPQTLDRLAEYRWEGQDRILRETAQQFLGPGDQTIILDGQLYPGFTGSNQTIETLRSLAAQGKPQMLSDGVGRVYGRWGIKRIREGQSTFVQGGAARRIDFTIELVRYGEDNPGAAASPLSVAPVLQKIVSTLPVDLETFSIADSAFDATSWASSIEGTPVAEAARGAGFSFGQLAGIAQSVANQNYVQAALSAFGLAGLNIDQSNVWAQVGINAAQMVQQMAAGRGPEATAIALDALRPATTAMLNTLGGSIGGGQALQDMINAAATITTMLDVDPYVTDTIRSLVRP